MNRTNRAFTFYAEAVENYNNWQYDKSISGFRQFLGIAQTEKSIPDSMVFKATYYLARCSSACGSAQTANDLYDSALVKAEQRKDNKVLCRLLLDYGEHLLSVLDSQKAIGLIYKAKEIARQSSSDELSFQANLLLAQYRRIQYRFADEKSILDSLSNIVQSLKKPELKFSLALEFALYYESILHFPESELHALQALSIARSIDKKAYLAEAYYTLGRAKLVNKTIDDLPDVLDSAFYYFNTINQPRRVTQTKVLQIRYYLYSSQFNKSFAEINLVEPILIQSNDTFNLAELVFYKADIYKNWKNFDEELRLLEQAEMLAQKSLNQGVLLKTQERLADRYFDAKNESVSFDYINNSIAKSRIHKFLFGEFHGLIDMKYFYQKKKDYAMANVYLDSAYALANNNLLTQLFSNVFTQKASISYYKSKFEEAIDLYKKALSFDSLYSSQWEIGINLFNVSMNFAQLEQNDESEQYFQNAANIFEQSGNKVMASRLYEIKAKLFYMKAKKNGHDVDQLAEMLNKSIKYALKAIKLKEEIRLTADDESKKKYLDAEYGIYQMLISCYKQLGDSEAEFAAIETSKTKWLEERINHNTRLKQNISLTEMQARIDDKTLFLSFAKRVEHYYYASAIDKDDYFSLLLYKSRFVIDSLKQVEGFLSYLDTILSVDDLRLFKEQSNNIANELQFLKEVFFHFINYYRDLIQQNSHDPIQKKDFYCASKALYRFLISPFKQQLQGKEKIIIIPDGLLGFIPFETLINDEGKYLIEDFDIQYIQSASVWNMLNERKYENRPMEIIAFGGAEYGKEDFTRPLYADATPSPATNSDVMRLRRDVYSAYGYDKFIDIPGSLSEIENISEEFSKKKIYAGKKVTESLIKELSEENKLGKYKIIHFSTHGIFIPEHPNMSAIVLPPGKNEEDGFLTADEIAMLRLNADFVNLSACETGLGKIYEGEGVVGIAQSFVIAGANALSVSLWQVADNSTSLFMTELYKMVKDENISYATAMNRIKRKFIKGEYHKALDLPYFWAPFVYYGK
ncbi:MAG: CHAT domain-containing protein [Bacteroidales bacterium]|nr:CHAT domain-containing protein [Bacteroidales bacterium]